MQASNIFALAELETILGSFNKTGIPALLLKGAGLLETVYKDNLERSICDIDIMVHQNDLKKTDDQMLSLGYASVSHNWGNHISYAKTGITSIPVEIHWDLFNRQHPVEKYAFGIKAEDVWQDAEPVQVGGQTARIMSPENQILYLSCHLIKESFSDPKWVRDLDKIIRYYQGRLDWQKLNDAAAKYGTRIPAWFALTYARKTMDTPIPPGTLEKLAGKHIPGYADNLMERISHNDHVARQYFIPLYMSSINTPLDKFRAIIEITPYLVCRSFMMKRSLNSWKNQPCHLPA